jgi:two-component system sensor histidine kinase ResE
LKGALIFLEESLSPYEITHRGYQDAVELKHHITRFTSVACHEVKAPLTSILSSAGMLQELLEAEQGTAEHRLFTNLLKGVEILKSRTDDMMDIAGLYSGTLSIRIRPVNIAIFMRQVYSHLELEARWKGLELHLHLDKNLSYAEFDPDRIEQVITNLVQNAIKYASDGGSIDLAASAQENTLIIEIRDYGNGVSLGEHLMEVLSDRRITRDSQAHGTGLGLILCRELIEAHRGRISVSSIPGNGHIFQLCLPFTQDHRNVEGVSESTYR